MSDQVTSGWDQSVAAMARQVRSGEVTARELIEGSLSRISAVDGEVKAYLRSDSEQALQKADEIDRRREAGESLGILAGVPVALKDNLSLKGHALTCGSKILNGYVAPYTGTAVERLLAEDAVVVGQVNMDEFAMGSSCENSAHFPSRNPWDLERVPGGSSGGSAAAVAASTVPLALGSDTGGSIRQPAALCGVVGIKPTYGRVSRYGLVAFASSLDQIGPITRTVEDGALALQAIAGADERDATCARAEVADYLSDLERGIQGLKVGVLKEVDSEQFDSDVRDVWEKNLQTLKEAGAELVELSIPNLPAAVAAYYVLANSEASANLSRFDGSRYGHRTPGQANLLSMYFNTRSEGFGTEVKRRIMLGTYTLSSGYYDQYYSQAHGVVRALRGQFAEAFKSVDVLVTPTAPTGAFRVGEKSDDPLSMYLSDIFTTPASLVGVPAVAVPSGFDEKGLPLSLQIMGKHFDEATVLRAARGFERQLDLKAQPDLAV